MRLPVQAIVRQVLTTSIVGFRFWWCSKQLAKELCLKLTASTALVCCMTSHAPVADMRLMEVCMSGPAQHTDAFVVLLQLGRP